MAFARLLAAPLAEAAEPPLKLFESNFKHFDVSITLQFIHVRFQLEGLDGEICLQPGTWALVTKDAFPYLCPSEASRPARIIAASLAKFHTGG
jgi:hypothetical protein